VSRTAPGPTQPCIQWVPGAVSLGVKWPVHEADHSPPSSAQVEEWVELYLHSPNTPSWRGAELKQKHRDNFTFTFYIWWKQRMGNKNIKHSNGVAMKNKFKENRDHKWNWVRSFKGKFQSCYWRSSNTVCNNWGLSGLQPLFDPLVHTWTECGVLTTLPFQVWIYIVFTSVHPHYNWCTKNGYWVSQLRLCSMWKWIFFIL